MKQNDMAAAVLPSGVDALGNAAFAIPSGSVAALLLNASTQASSSVKGKYAAVDTQNDAIDVVESLFDRQLARAQVENPPINTSIGGDAEAMNAFRLLLDLDVQRTVFLQRARDRAFWPRIRSLVGSPPFAFLFPEDDSVLNAAGITVGRVHMAPSERGSILSTADIGEGQFSDTFDRRYRVVAVDGRAGAVTAVGFRALQRGVRCVLDLRLPRMKQKERVSIYKRLKAETAGLIRFPVAGEEVRLTLNEKLTGSGNTERVTIAVKGVRQRSSGSPAARAFCIVSDVN